VPRKSSERRDFLLLENSTQYSNFGSDLGGDKLVEEICVGIYHTKGQELITTILQKSTKLASTCFALEVIDSCQLNLFDRPVIVSSTQYGCKTSFIQGLEKRELNFCVKIRPSTKLLLVNGEKAKAIDLIDRVEEWKIIEIIEPKTGRKLKYLVADLCIIIQSIKCRAFVAKQEGISGVNRGTIIGLSSLLNTDLTELVEALSWTNCIGSILKNKERDLRSLPSLKQNEFSYSGLNLRPNITIARQQENELLEKDLLERELKPPNFRGIIQSKYDRLNIVELFAGAGGMGLGFSMANNYNNLYRLILSGEVHPIYAQTLRQNHQAISQIYHCGGAGFIPDGVEPMDLRSDLAYESIKNCAQEKGGVQILIGGPPCQGFSSSNRNSGDESNPHNRLVEVFMDYVERIRPPIALMENVQGIVWARNYDSTHESLLDYFTYRMQKAGYLVFKRLLDAAWYGVPQFRYRFFALLIHQDLGYQEEDFDPEWGAFPFPTHGGKGQSYVTVEQAIKDLPQVENGYSQSHINYEKLEFGGVASAGRENRANISNQFLQLMRQGADPGVITDHITSRHADYVIDRYKEIPPGGNWQNIKDKMTNYADLNRTHSNIYRRLTWSDPSVTIGHYRKSMLIHPEQHRGLSLREAARLQSFPDWFVFSGTTDGRKGGLMHKQQQVANAVCPLLTKAIAEFILKL
jgi:DNA-cytosine methyltransferase